MLGLAVRDACVAGNPLGPPLGRHPPSAPLANVGLRKFAAIRDESPDSADCLLREKVSSQLCCFCRCELAPADAAAAATA
ncbi:Hypothetical predicted protein [Cloeon dipterum]|uniref:Uncharacterized protein n=1 Tax=Cloeon dipterum TaxID=197152 RepID=A0A8S1CD64_9INSE|nr:Hypothetical predicted protein [Cloeon dipterum]